MGDRTAAAAGICRVGFFMDMIAGHVTNYHNLRRASRAAPNLAADWHEIAYYKAGGDIERVRENLLPFVPSYFSGVLRGALEMRRSLRDYTSYDALFTNASVAVFFCRQFRRVPTMIDFDSTPLQIDRMQAYGSSADPAPVAHLKWRLSRNMMHSATVLQAWSRWARQSAIDEYGVAPEKIIVNPPGIDLGFWKPDRADKGATSPFRILFVGGDFRRKGGELLLEWYRGQVPARCELHIVPRVDVRAPEGVFIYRGINPNSDELIGLYRKCDLFVLPSLGECFGIATVEAMGAGLPVIASDVGGTADIIDQGRNGLIVAGGSPADLGGAIERIMGDARLKEDMAVQSRAIAEERFDLHRNAATTFEYLRRIARRRESASEPMHVPRAPAA